MSSLVVVIPLRGCAKWGPEQRPKELTESVTNQEYQKMQDTMDSCHMNGLGAGGAISGIIVTALMIIAIVDGNYATLGVWWCIGIPTWALCIAIATSWAKAKVNAEILNPKGMNLQRHGCFAYEIVTMSSLGVVLPLKCCSKWGPEQRPEELMESVTNQEYQKMRDIMDRYRMNGLGAAASISGIIVTVFLIIAIVADEYLTLGQIWCIGIPWALCIAIATSMAKAKINAEILNPKGMTLQCHGCFAHKIVLLEPILGSVGNAARIGGIEEIVTQSAFEQKSQSTDVFGKREREGAPSNYGTVELTHSSKSDVGEDVVRSMYTHISDGVTRSERIIPCNMKIVYVPEEDLLDLAQVYNSQQMGELRVKSKSQDGARRVLRFFYNNGSSVQGASVVVGVPCDSKR